MRQNGQKTTVYKTKKRKLEIEQQTQPNTGISVMLSKGEADPAHNVEPCM